jgi:hypothetical protein
MRRAGDEERKQWGAGDRTSKARGRCPAGPEVLAAFDPRHAIRGLNEFLQAWGVRFVS